MPTAEEVVNAFIAAMGRRDLDAAMALLADDVEYDNVPIPTVHGRQAARDFLAPLVDMFQTVEFVVHRQIVSGDVVFNERTDRFLNDGQGVELPVAGVFEVRDGQIALWRDYFDMSSFTGQMSG